MSANIVLKRSINDVFKEVLTESTSSSLSSGTKFTLVEGGFWPSTNNLQTILTSLDLNYKKAKLYFGSTKNINKPDLSRQWFVYYSYKNPATGKFERQPPIYKEINSFDSIAGRRVYGNSLIDVVNDLLAAGWSPYDVFVDKRDGSLNKNIINCIDLYLSEKKKSLAPKSYAPYKQHVGWFEDWIRENKLSHINIDQIKRFQIVQFLSDYRERSEKQAREAKASAKRKPASNRQINNIKDNISSFFNYFKTNFEDEVSKNPVKGITDLPNVKAIKIHMETPHASTNIHLLEYRKHKFWSDNENAKIKIKDAFYYDFLAIKNIDGNTLKKYEDLVRRLYLTPLL